MIKKILLLVFCLLFINTTSSNVAVYPAKVGDTFEFDFGGAVRQLEVKRYLGNGIEKLYPSTDLKDSLSKNKGSQYPTNAYLSKDGLLIIDPVTEEDFGTYKSDVYYHPRFAYPTLKVVPIE